MSIRKNIFYNIILTSSSVIFPLITFPYVTRVLGPGNYGNVNFIDAIIQYLLILSTLGIPIYGIREVSRLKGAKKELTILVFELLAIQLTLTVIAVVSIVFLTSYFVVESNYNMLLYIGSLILFFNIFVWDWFYQGMELYSYISYRSVLSKILVVLFILAFVQEKSDFNIYYFSFVVGLIITGGFNITYFFKNFYQPSRATLNVKRHLRPLLLIFFINLSVSFYTLFDTMILGFIDSNVSVGYYSFSIRLVKIFWTLVSAVGLVLIPRLSILIDEERFEEVNNLMTKSLNVILILCIPFAGFAMYFSKDIVLLISGHEFSESYKSLAILSLLPLIIGVTNVFGIQFLMPMKKEKHILTATMVGMFVSLSLNFALIPYLSEVGAAISCLISESVVCFIIFLYSRRFIQITIDRGLIILIFTSFLLSAPLVFWVGLHLSSTFTMLTSVIIYLLILLTVNYYIFKNKFINDQLRLIL